MKLINITNLTLAVLLACCFFIILNQNGIIKKLSKPQINPFLQENTILRDSIIRLKEEYDILNSKKDSIHIVYQTFRDTVETFTLPKIKTVLDTILNDSIKICNLDSVDYMLFTDDLGRKVIIQYSNYMECKAELFISNTMVDHCEYLYGLQTRLVEEQDSSIINFKLANKQCEKDKVDLENNNKKLKKSGLISWGLNIIQLVLHVVR